MLRLVISFGKATNCSAAVLALIAVSRKAWRGRASWCINSNDECNEAVPLQ